MKDPDGLRRALLDWYDREGRSLPWRVRGRRKPDPYRIWLSEIMLQQTTTAHAAPYFHAFTQRWPTVSDLAAADDADVMAAWAGLGYYARARNLLACARKVAVDLHGRFPDTEAALRTLPGLGAYTAAAVAAIAFGEAANVVDGNVERVMARLFRVQSPLPAARPELRGLAGQFIREDRPGDWAQALMDLGAEVCRPKSPRCEDCPVAGWCRARAAGEAQSLPKKAAKAERPQRRGLVYVMRHGGDVALIRRPDKGLLGGMLGLPGSDWTAAPSPPAAAPPADLAWRKAGHVEHVFTHFGLDLTVMTATATGARPGGFIWTTTAKAREGLPTVFRKALDRALG